MSSQPTPPPTTDRQPLDARAHLGDGESAAREAGDLVALHVEDLETSGPRAINVRTRGPRARNVETTG